MNKNTTWAEILEACKKTIEQGTEQTNIELGIAIGELKREYFYNKLISFLKGDDKDNGSMYFERLKPLYDKYGYEKVNRVLLSLEEPKAEEKAEDKGAENE